LGLLLVAEGLAVFVPGNRAQITVLAATFVILLVVLTGVLTSYEEMDQSKNDVARRLGEDILSTAKPGTLLLVAGDEAAALSADG
jgi:hypothetical protein